MLLRSTDRRFLLRVARFTLDRYLVSGERGVMPTESPALLGHRAAFVTLRHRATGELRGCRGETEPRRPLVESVAVHAIAAAVDDPRFAPVARVELDELVVHISALTVPRPIARDEVELGRHGVMIVHKRRCGLLLPQVPALYDIATVDDFLSALCRKATLPRSALDDPATRLLGFEAEDWGEEDEPEAPE